MGVRQNRYRLYYGYTVRGIKKLSSTAAGTDADTGTDTGAIDNT